MSLLAQAWTYGGFSVTDPRSLLNRLDNSGSPISRLFVQKANSYRCPTGRPYGQGWCLLNGEQVAALDFRTSYSFSHVTTTGANRESSTTESVTFPALFPLRAICLTPGYDQNFTDEKMGSAFFSQRNRRLDYKAVYLVELVDRRYYMEKYSAINKCFNLRNPAKAARGGSDISSTLNRSHYYVDSLNTNSEPLGLLWNWSEMLQEIWSTISYRATLTIPESFTPPERTPENFTFFGTSAYAAFHQVLDVANATLVYDPFTDLFSIVNSDAELSTPADNDSLQIRKIYDYDVAETDGIIIPESFDVFFKRQYRYAGTEPDVDSESGRAKSYVPNCVHTEHVVVTSIDGFGSIPVLDDANEGIWCPYPLIVEADGEPTIEDDLEGDEQTVEEQAEEFVKLIVKRRLGQSRTGKQVYRGLPSGIVPNQDWKIVTWRDYGDAYGICTEVESNEGTDRTASPTSLLSSPEKQAGWSAFGIGGFNAFGLQGTLQQAAGTGSNITPPAFGQISARDFSRVMQFVTIVPSEDEEAPEVGEQDGNYSYNDGVTIGGEDDANFYLHPGKVVICNPTTNQTGTGVLLSWNRNWEVEGDDNLGPDCYIGFTGLDPRTSGGADNEHDFHRSRFHGLVGQVWLGKLQGSAGDGKPIYIVSFVQDFVTGILDDDLLCDDANGFRTAEMTGEDGRTYVVDGRFIPDNKQLGAGSYVGCHAAPLFTTASNDAVFHYWPVVVSKECPEAIPEEE